MSCTISY